MSTSWDICTRDNFSPGRSGYRWSGAIQPSHEHVLRVCARISLPDVCEVEDGFHRIYGFSPGDAFFNMIGAAFRLHSGRSPSSGISRSNTATGRARGTGTNCARDRGGRSSTTTRGQQCGWASTPFFVGERLADALPHGWPGVRRRGKDWMNWGGRRQATIALDYNFSRIQTGATSSRRSSRSWTSITSRRPASGLTGNGSSRVFYP